MVPPAPADGRRRRPGPRLPPRAAATTARSCAGSAWDGPPTGGTPCAPRSSSARTWPSAPGSASSTNGAGSRTPSGPGCCSPSATRRATPSPSAAASCRGSRDPAKYKNSSETPIYSKRRTLYALNWAKQDVIATGEVVVCEGYTDVIGFFEAGVPRAVATCGTALAEEHVQAAQELRHPDRAGLRRRRGRPVGRRSLLRVGASRSRSTWPSPPCRRAPTPPIWPGPTPPPCARPSTRPRPFLQFRLGRILDAADLSTAEGRARAADHALGAVAEHPDDLVRDQYVMQVAERCRLEPASLRDRLERIRREGPRTPANRSEHRPVPPARHRDPRGYDGPDEPGPEPGWDPWEDGRARRSRRSPHRVPAGPRGAAPGHPPTRGRRRPPRGRCCSPTRSSGPPSRPWSTPTTSARPSTRPRGRSRPCWSDSPWRSPGPSPTRWWPSWSATPSGASCRC